MLTYSVLALPLAVGHHLGGQVLPDRRALRRGARVVDARAEPADRSRSTPTTGTPLACAAASWGAISERSVALTITALAPLSQRGVERVLELRRRSIGRDRRGRPAELGGALSDDLPCSSHCAAPQLMNTIFLPDGTALPTGLVTVIAVGRCDAWATICWAWLLAPDAPAELVAAALLAVAARAAARRAAALRQRPRARQLSAASTAARRIRLQRRGRQRHARISS